MDANCSHYVEDPAICDDVGEPKGQCANCGEKWYDHDMTSTEYKSIREKLGLTQAALAARLGVTRKTINARENGAKIMEEAALAIRSLSSPNAKGDSQSPANNL